MKKIFGKKKTKTPTKEVVAVEAIPEPIMDARDEVTVPNDEMAVSNNDAHVDDKSILSNGSRDETVCTQKTEKTIQTEQVDETKASESDTDDIKYQRVNTLTADITLPEGVKEGDYIDIDHDGVKKIKVPIGQKGGDSILVKMISTKDLEDESADVGTPAFCGCF